jgi:NitT/TauT family transport system ATP-binding protein
MVELKNIYKSFDKSVLSDFSATFPKGITCVMGASGSGKTTIANIIAGFVKPESGEIIGVENKKIAMVFQEDRLLEWESALTNVLFVKDSRERAAELLTQAKLGDSLHKKIAEFSGGMKRRVCLCRALIAEYDILILDEPFKGMDNELKPQIMEMVRSVNDKIIICITHDPSEAEFMCGGIVKTGA